MSERKQTQDTSINLILKQVLELAAGNLDHRVTQPQNGDSLDAIITGLNMLGEEFSAQHHAYLQATDKYKDLYDNAPDMLLSLDVKTAKIIECNQTLSKSLGYTKEEIIGQPVFWAYHPDCIEEANNAFQSFVETGEVHDAELELKRKDGSKIDVSLNVSAVRDEQGNILYSRSIWRDITEFKRAENALREQEESLEKLVAERTTELTKINNKLQNEIVDRKNIEKRLVYLAQHDPLTNLYNKPICEEMLNKAISRAIRHKKHAAILYVDIDNFKNINDSMGHEAGDHLLREIAKLITKTIRKSDVASRTGGDEFVIILDDINNPQQAGVVAKKLIDTVSATSFRIDEKAVNTTISIGVATFPRGGESTNELFKNADTAMYQAKKNGKNNYIIYSQGLLC